MASWVTMVTSPIEMSQQAHCSPSLPITRCWGGNPRVWGAPGQSSHQVWLPEPSKRFREGTAAPSSLSYTYLPLKMQKSLLAAGP